MTDYDNPATFRGQLRRGRGIAVHRAMTEPNAAEAVYECVFEDLRWDQACDERDSYLATLICRLSLPLAPIEQRLDLADDAESVEYALGVLALLPFVGRADAASVLRRYAIEGRYRQAALDAIGGSGAFQLAGFWDGLAGEVAAAYDDDQIAQAVGFGGDPWKLFAESQPRIRVILEEVTATRAARRPPAVEYRARQEKVTEASTDALVRSVAIGGQERALALVELGRRGEQCVLDLAEQISRDNLSAQMPGMSQALGHLGAGAVPRVRGWSAGDDRTLAHLAVKVLAEHGDAGDTRTLHAALNSYVAESDWCAAETPARGLGRLGAREAADDLTAAWEGTPHSLARVDFLQALVGCGAPHAEACAEEGLSDCQPEVQHVACAHAPGSTSVRRRLREIAHDPLAPQAREAANARLRLLA